MVANPQSKVVLSGPRALLPRTSPEFAASTLEELRFRWASVRDDERRFMAVLGEVVEARLYERWPTDAPYGDIDRLCREELGAPLATVREAVATTAKERIARAAQQTTGALGQAGRPPANRDDSSRFGRSDRAASNGIGAHTQGRLDYLARKAPTLLREVQGGRSVNDAYRQARGLPKRVTITMTLEQIDRALRTHLNAGQLKALIALLQHEVAG